MMRRGAYALGHATRFGAVRRCLSAEGPRTALGFEAELLSGNTELEEKPLKSRYLKLAKRFHPDLNKEDPNAAERFVELGKAFEKLMRRAQGKPEDDAFEDYDEDAAFATFDGLVLNAEQRRELKKIAQEMSAGGARDGGLFALAEMLGEDDGTKAIPGAPATSDAASRPPLQLTATGRKVRRSFQR